MKLLWRYLNYLVGVLIAPVSFLNKNKEVDFKGDPLTFFLLNVWVVSFFLTLAVYFAKVFGIGVTIVEGLSAKALLFLSPVVLLFALTFFVMVFFLIGGTVVLFLSLLYLLMGALFYLLGKISGEKIDFDKILLIFSYASLNLILFLLPFILIIFFKHERLSLDYLHFSFSVVYLISALLLGWILGVASQVLVGIKGAKRFLISFLIAVFFGGVVFLFDKLLLARILSFLA